MGDSGLGPGRSLRADEAFAPFFAEPFDAAQFSSALIETDADAAYLARLTGGIARLEREASSTVTDHSDDLLSHLDAVVALGGRLAAARGRTDALVTSAGRVHASLTAPCDRLRGQAATLRRVYDACGLLRSLHRLLYLARRLSELLEPAPTDVAMAAEYLHEARAILATVDLRGIDVADVTAPRLVRYEASILSHARAELRAGLEAGNHADIGTALQTLANLRRLREHVTEAVRALCDKTVAASSALSLAKNELALPAAAAAAAVSAGASGAGAGAAGGGAAAPAAGRAALWASVDVWLDVVYRAALQLLHLRRVLRKCRDVRTRSALATLLAAEAADAAAADGGVASAQAEPHDWSHLVNALGAALGAVARRAPAVASTLASEYPRLLKKVLEVSARLADHTHAAQAQAQAHAKARPGGARGAEPPELGPLQPPPPGGDRGGGGGGGGGGGAQPLGGALRQLEGLYLRQVNSRLMDSAGRAATASFTMAAADSALDPAVAGASLLADAVAAELRAASAHAPLELGVAVACAKALKAFMAKSEELFEPEPLATALALVGLGAPAAAGGGGAGAGASGAAARGAEGGKAAAGKAAAAAQRRNAALCRALEVARARIAALAAEGGGGGGGGGGRAGARAAVCADAAEVLHQRAAELDAQTAALLRPLREALARALLPAATAALLRGGGLAPVAAAIDFVTSNGALAPFAHLDWWARERCALGGALLGAAARAVCAARPLDEPRQMSLAAELPELELLAQRLCALETLNSLGEPYAHFKKLLPLVFATLDTHGLGLGSRERGASVRGVWLGMDLSSLPRELLVHHLFARAPRALRSPYEVAGLSSSLYLDWAATAKPDAICALVSTAVDEYERARGVHGAADGCADEETLRGRAVARMIRLLSEDWLASSVAEPSDRDVTRIAAA